MREGHFDKQLRRRTAVPLMSVCPQQQPRMTLWLFCLAEHHRRMTAVLPFGCVPGKRSQLLLHLSVPACEASRGAACTWLPWQVWGKEEAEGRLKALPWAGP